MTSTQLNFKNIREAAEGMIARHGDGAADRALGECRRLKAAGEADAAQDWERLYKAILHVRRRN
jgi:hypothetical protein